MFRNSVHACKISHVLAALTLKTSLVSNLGLKMYPQVWSVVSLAQHLWIQDEQSGGSSESGSWTSLSALGQGRAMHHPSSAASSFKPPSCL